MTTDITKIDLSKLSMDELWAIWDEPWTPEEIAEEEEAMKYLPITDDEDADIVVQTVMMKKKRGKKNG